MFRTAEKRLDEAKGTREAEMELARREQELAAAQAAAIDQFLNGRQEPDYTSYERFSSGQSHPCADINVTPTTSFVHAGGSNRCSTETTEYQNTFEF